MNNINLNQKLNQLEQQCLDFITQEMQNDAAHDTQHILRVVKTAKQLCEQENADINIILPAAYLHDCYLVAKDSPLRSQASKLSADKAIEFLNSINYDKQYLDAIYHAILTHSFSANIPPETLEAKIVQDADRLDALGAIGIARLMQTSTLFNSQIYHVNDPFCQSREPDDKAYAVDHFYAKLFLLEKDLNTQAAKNEAKKRNEFMTAYLKELAREI